MPDHRIGKLQRLGSTPHHHQARTASVKMSSWMGSVSEGPACNHDPSATGWPLCRSEFLSPVVLVHICSASLLAKNEGFASDAGSPVHWTAPGFPETVLANSHHYDESRLIPIVYLLELDWRNVPDQLQESSFVVPGHPVERREIPHL